MQDLLSDRPVQRCRHMGKIRFALLIGNAKSFFRYDLCSKNLNPP